MRLIFAILIFCCANVYAQNSSLVRDSNQDAHRVESLLEKAIQSAAYDLEESAELSKEVIRLAKLYNLPIAQAKAQLNICGLYNSDLDYDSIAFHCEEAILFFKSVNDTENLAWTYNRNGIIQDIKGNREAALESFNNSLLLFQHLNDSIGIAYNLNDLGVVKNFMGEYVEASNYYFSALQIFEKFYHKKGLLRVKTSMGYFFKRQIQYEKAKDYFISAIQLAEKVNDKQFYALTLSGYVKLLRSEKRFDEAKRFNQKVIDLADSLKSNYYRLDAYSNQAYILNDLKNPDEAEYYALKSLHLFESQHRKQNKPDLMNLLGDIYLQKRELDKAKDYLYQVKSEKSIPITTKVENYHLLAAYYTAKSNFEKAFEFQQKFIDLNEVLWRKEKIRTIASVENGYELGKKEGEILNLSQENKLQRELLNERNNLLIAVVILSLILCLTFFKLYRDNKNMNTNLESMVIEKTKDLISVNAKLEKRNEELSRFAFITSHDLKEPLRNISGFLHLVERELDEKHKESTHEYILMAKSSAIQLNRLIDDVMNYSELDDYVKNVQEVDMNLIIEQILTTMKPVIEERKVVIDLEPLPVIKAMSADMIRLFQNLIENGIKFNDSTYPRIEISCVWNEKEYCFFVKDNGIGIEKEYSDQIFGMFKRLHHRQAYSGSGIGLASCQKIVDKYGGEIHVQSKFKEGSTFIVTLPNK